MSRYHVTVEIDDRTLDFQKPLPDPFHSTTVRIGWPDLLRGLLHRGLRVTVRLGADPQTVRDVMTRGDRLVDGEPAQPASMLALGGHLSTPAQVREFIGGLS